MIKSYMKNKCVDCGHSCCKTAQRCRTCQNKRHSDLISGADNPFYGKRHTVQVKNILRKKAKEYNKLFGNPFTGKSHKQATKIHMSLQKLGSSVTFETRKKISLNHADVSGKKNPMFGKRGSKSSSFGKIMNIPDRQTYKGICMRSSWEINFSKWCDLSGIKWEYESKVFDLGECTYTPDFYLPEFDCYIEIKGYFTDYAKIKIRKFKQQYPKINFKLLKHKELVNLSII